MATLLQQPNVTLGDKATALRTGMTRCQASETLGLAPERTEQGKYSENLIYRKRGEGTVRVILHGGIVVAWCFFLAVR